MNCFRLYLMRLLRLIVSFVCTKTKAHQFSCFISFISPSSPHFFALKILNISPRKKSENYPFHEFFLCLLYFDYKSDSAMKYLESVIVGSDRYGILHTFLVRGLQSCMRIVSNYFFKCQNIIARQRCYFRNGVS